MFLDSCPWPVSAQTITEEKGHKAGHWFFYPYFTLQQQFSDNIYRVPRETKSDFIFVSTPGVKIERPAAGSDNVLKMDFSEDLTRYYHSAIEKNKFKGKAEADLFFDRYSLLFKTDYKELYDVASDFTAGQGGLVDYSTMQLAAVLKGAFNRLSFELGATRTKIDYAGQAGIENDRYETEFTGTGYFRIMPKTHVLLEYSQLRSDYTHALAPSRNSVDHKIFTGLKGQVAPKVFGKVKIGFQTRRYATADQLHGNVVNLSLEHRLSTFTRFFWIAEKGLEDSTYEDEGGVDRTVLTFYGLHNLAFNRKITLLFGAQYEEDSYPDRVPNKRRDEAYSGHAGFNYRIQDWFDVELMYRYSLRDSTEGDSAYRENALSLTSRFRM